MSELDPQLCERNLEAVEGLLDVLDGSRMGAGMSYAELGRLVGSDGDTMKGALNRSIEITLSDLMMIALALDVRLALGILPPDDEQHL